MIFIRDLLSFVHNVFMTSGRTKKFDLSYWIYHVTAVDFDNKYAYCNSLKIQFDLDDEGLSLYGVRISKIEWNLIFTTVNKINNHS